MKSISQFSRYVLATLSLTTVFGVAAPSVLGVSFSTPDGVAGAPRTRTSGGASRTNGQCLVGQEDLAAMRPVLPNFERVLTVSEHPSFFVSVPETTAQTGSFSLQDSSGDLHYRTSVNLPAQGGIVQITLPTDHPEIALGEDYSWYFEVHCVSEFDPNNPTIEGTVYRLPVDESLAEALTGAETDLHTAQVYGDFGIWYDALATLATAHHGQPDNEVIAENWNQLLTSVGLEALSQQSLNLD
ncbi:DUF928 domain-containing protein [Geitlerinema sp. P-1104]|uniref:DUF928 domain-containing protein n=1 Tax=Geitlerinema sp. P-1104 TaxID=2546230 RepID=UPI001476FDA7|nr:DUF928 domain-containing protein [Geitlerinema sp. P-1104]NMG59081.1 DUF928 domain-containing protein [Geitlerinema sp. P-1104]